MITLYGSAYVADMLEVNRAVMSNWLKRHSDTPEPYATMQESVGRWDRPRYLWDDNGLEQWRQWHVERLTNSPNLSDKYRTKVLLERQRNIAALMMGNTE